HASATAKRKRRIGRTGDLNAAPVAAVKPDHQITIRESTARVPRRSAHHAVGISNTAYASWNTVNTYPIWTVVRPRSRVMPGASVAIHARSRWVIIARPVASATTR